MTKKALGIIDGQRGFMPLEEGQRLHIEGFGELPVPCGEQIVESTNRLIDAYSDLGYPVFTTQDWHPKLTAHFSDEPDFSTNWPIHCVGDTPGAELHPEIKTPASTVRFIKGFEPLEKGEDDTSYSGYYAKNPVDDQTLPEWIKENGITEVLLGGLALDYCVGKTALDLRQKLGLQVIVALDAAKGINDSSTTAMLEQFAANQVQTTTTDKWLRSLT